MKQINQSIYQSESQEMAQSLIDEMKLHGIMKI